MTEKDIATRVIDALPEGATLDEIMHALYVRNDLEANDSDLLQNESIASTRNPDGPLSGAQPESPN